ncbi:MAG: GH3 auxin-responsive promoter family protein [Planctomycetaceae bacterium]|nr:GH3 auxin-responsive promoter family protein [Planctomycetaceae bacterium]
MTNLPLRNRLRQILGTSHRRSILRQRDSFLEATRIGCAAEQTATLNRLLALNSGTQFSRDFGLNAGTTVEEFRRQVPVAGFELVQPYVEKVKNGQHNALLGQDNKLLMFALTSGTTADSKLIPVTQQFVNDYRRGWQNWGIGLYFEYPQLQPLNMVQITSSHKRFLAPDGTPCGNISGLVAAMQGRIVRSMYSVPSEIAHVTDSDVKKYAALKYAIQDPFVGMVITANPSTVLQMVELLESKAEWLVRDIHDGTMTGCLENPTDAAAASAARLKLRPDRNRSRQLESLLTQRGTLSPMDVWPDLVALGVWCGGSAGAYVSRLRRLFPGIVVRDHGLHASEGRMTMPIHNDSSAGVLEVQTHFFEFLPVAESQSSTPVTLLAQELQEGQEYFILLTTSSGLYRYNIKDVVRCVGFHGSTPMLEFLHKGAHISSITGEKIAESQVVQAVRTSADALQLQLRLFTMTPQWNEPPGYVLFVDLVDYPDQQQLRVDTDKLAELAAGTDTELRNANLEYREKRETGRLAPVTCQLLDRARWDQFTASRTQRGGGSVEQYKHPCLLPDPQFESLFLKACGTA